MTLKQHTANNTTDYRAGAVIFETGERGDTMYIVQRGEVELYTDGVMVSVLKAGDCFGEMALFSSAPRTQTAVARTDCALMVVDKRRLYLLLQHHPSLAQHLLKVLHVQIVVRDAAVTDEITAL